VKSYLDFDFQLFRREPATGHNDRLGMDTGEYRMSNFKKGFWLTTALTAAVAGFSPAMAQQAAPEPTPTAAPTSAADDSNKEEEQIVVTGSRIKRDDFTATSPVQIITQESATLEGLIDTSDILQSSAIAAGSFQTNNQLTGFVTTGGPGVNTVSLRGLGAQRTLVILNGRRAGPAGTRGQVGAVDLNVIPSSIIERVEILKDGASSIYGSDALAGVVNLITRQNLDGGEINASGNISEEGGGNQYRISGSWGKVFDRGYINGSLEYYKQNILHRGSRDDTSCAADYLFNANTGARIDYLDADTQAYKCYNLFANVLRTATLGDLIYTRPGITYPNAAAGNNSPVVGMAREGRAGFPATYPYANYEFSEYDRASIISPAERYTAYVTAGYDLTPSTEVYGEFLYNQRKSEQLGVRQFFPSVAAANPNNVRPDTGLPFVGSLLPIIPLKSDNAQQVDYLRAVVGVKGNLDGILDGWTWDVYGQYSKSDATYTNDMLFNDRVLAITGTTACNQAAITISGGSCANLPGGIPWTSQRVLAGQFNAAERAFLFNVEEGSTTYTHQFVEGSASGDLFQLPAGGLGAAVGFQIRKEEIDDTPGPNARANNLWGSTSAGRTAGSDTVKEVFAEFEVPILKGVPLFQSLTANLSGRHSEYDSYGNSDTYKVGLNWQITPAFRIRASDGTSFRAPALYELYLANQTGFLGQTAIDPCISYENSSSALIQANCAAAGIPTGYTGAGSSSATIITGGGKGILDPETGESKTVGIVWTPDFIDLNIAIDYFEIGIKDEVRTFGAANILNQCYTSPNYPNNPYCTLFTRGVAVPGGPNQVLTVNNSYVNVAEQDNRGIDLSIRYKQETGIGDFTLTGNFTWQLRDIVDLLGPGSQQDNNGSTFNFDGPDFTGSAQLRYDRNDWTAQWSMNFIGKGSDTENFGGDTFNSSRYANLPAGINPQRVYFKQYTEFTAYHDLSVRKKFDDWSVQLGVVNMFDERPPSQSSGQFRSGTAALNGYDIIGRRGFVAINKTF